MTKVLILGGTREGRLIADALQAEPRFTFLLSYAGRTESVRVPDVPHRIGGFGGADGLRDFLQQQGFDALVDATHPFAAQISSNAVHAARAAGVPLLRLQRPAWQPVAGDRWIEVADMAQAARALGSTPRRVFLTIGRLEIEAFHAAPQHHYLVRAVDPFDSGLPHAHVIAARGPFALEDELALLSDHGVELLVSKNAGTDATYAKLEAARILELPVVMVARPSLPQAQETAEVAGVLHWLHGSFGRERGV